MAYFRTVSERKLPHEVIYVKINPSMDIVALALANSDIAINRLYSWQRVWSISKPKFQNASTETIEIVDMIWSIDGKILAVAYNQPIEMDNQEKESISELKSSKYLSSIALYLIESNQRVCVHNLEFESSCLCWQVKSHCKEEESSCTKSINIDELKLPLDSVNIPYVDLFICDDELLNYPLNTTSNRHSKLTETNKYPMGKKFSSNLPPLTKFHTHNEFFEYDKMNLLQNKTFNILMVGTRQNVILFYLFGYYQIMKIDINSFLHNTTTDNDFQVDRVWLSSDLNCAQIFIKHHLTKNSYLFLFETQLLSSSWKEIYLVNRIRLNIDFRLQFLKDTIKEICSIWSDVVVDIESRLSNYQIVQETAAGHDRSDQGNQRTQLKPKDFIDMLIFGNISMNLERFLHDISKKEITKLFNSFEHCVNEIYRLIITRVLNTLAQIMSYLDNLRGMTLNDLQFGNLGFSIEYVNMFRREVSSMMDKCNKLMIILSDLKCKMLAFTRLIYKGIFMVQCTIDRNDYDNSKFFDDQTIGKMTLQDFHLVMDFLNNNSFANGFKFDMIGQMLRNSPSPSISSNFRNENFEDENVRNPYKSYLEERQLKHIIEVFNNSKNLIEMSEEDLLRTFSLKPDSNPKSENLQENDPDETRKWLGMLLNDYANIDSIDEQIFNSLSLYDHFNRLNQIKSTLLDHSFFHINDLQSKLIETSDNKMIFQLTNNGKEFQTIYSYLPISLDCYSVLNYQKNVYEIQSGYLYVIKFNSSIQDQDESTISLLRFRQPLQLDQIDFIQFQLIGKCFSQCLCKQVQFLVEDCQFYDTDLMTMIVSEKHSFQGHFTRTESSSHGSASSPKKQYLIQCQYTKIFDVIPDCIEKISNHTNFPLKIVSKNLPRKIDLSLNLDRIHNCNVEQQIDDEDEHLTIESLFKLRLLEMNSQQKFLSVSGNRNLACCRDESRSRITIFEMDSCEDEEEAVNIVPDEEGNNIEVAQLVEITPDGHDNLNHHG